MAAKLYIGRILSASLAISLVVTLAVSFHATVPAQASHFLTHPAGTAPSAPSLATQAAGQAGARSAAQTRALNATPNATPNATANAPASSSGAAKLFKKGTEIDIKNDANIYLTPRSIPDDDRLLGAYNADRPNGGQAQARSNEGAAVPGLLGIANQAHRAQDPDGRNAQAYSLADAMRDAIWRKKTMAKLRSLTTSLTACAEGAVKKTPVIGVAPSC